MVSNNGGYGSIMVGPGAPSGYSQPAFAQKRNSMGDKRPLKKQPVVNEDGKRPIRSANSSPTMHHFLMNQLGQQPHGLNLLQEILPTPQSSSNNGGLQSRPATSGLG